MSASILVVEDEPHLAQGIVDNLQADGYRVALATDGEMALQMFAAQPVDLLLLDLMLPRRDGYSVCRALRAQGSQVLVCFLSARNSHAERVMGLDAGGDDYLGKPFDLRELLARVRALLRRGKRGDCAVPIAGYPVDLVNAQFTDLDGTPQILSRREVLLLQSLSAAQGEVVSRDRLLGAAWGGEVYPSSRELEQWIQRLRDRFEVDPQAPIYFLGVPGDGYRLQPSVPST